MQCKLSMILRDLRDFGVAFLGYGQYNCMMKMEALMRSEVIEFSQEGNPTTSIKAVLVCANSDFF